MLKIYEECPQKFKLAFIDKIAIPETSQNAQTGTKLHALINYHLKGNDVTKMVTGLSKDEKLLWHNFINSPVMKMNYYNSEYEFQVKIDDYWLKGRIDAIFQTKDGFVIADWKTGKISEENERFQTMFYLYCMAEILKIKGLLKSYEELSLYYVMLHADTLLKIEFNEELYTKYKAKILNLAGKISSSSNYFCFKSEKCKQCRFFRFCPYI